MVSSDASPLALDGFRILDLADGKGHFCTRLLADLGADVVKVEPPGGDATRRVPPFKGDDPHPEKSLYFLHYNANKRGITLDLACAEGQELFRELAKRADVVVETFAPGTMASWGLGYAALERLRPGIIVTSITPFGQSGPWRDCRGNDLITFALGGLMALSGEPGGPPCVAPGELNYGLAGSYAAWGTLVALYHRLLSGEGQHVDVSVHECAAHIAGYAVPVYAAEGRKAVRSTRAKTAFELHDVYACQDGHVRFFIWPRQHWLGLLEWMGRPEELSGPVFEDQEMRRHNSDLIDPFVARLAMQYTKAELYEEAQQRHLAVSPVNTPGEFVKNAQTQGRGLFVSAEHPVIGPYQQLGPIHRFGETLRPPEADQGEAPPRIRRPAPLLGQHNEEIYCGELGLGRQELVALRGAGVI